MPNGHLEHINITVSDIERSADLLARLMGWHIRWRGPSQLGGETIHVGSEADYIAVYTHGTPASRFAKGQPLNHVGLVVDDLAAAEAVVKTAASTFNHAEYEPGKRFYFSWTDRFAMVSYG